MFLLFEIEDEFKKIILPKFANLVDISKELITNEIKYFKSIINFSEATLKQIFSCFLLALFFGITTVSLLCALITNFIIQLFPHLSANYIILEFYLISLLLFIISLSIIRNRLLDFKKQSKNLLTHYSGATNENNQL